MLFAIVIHTVQPAAYAEVSVPRTRPRAVLLLVEGPAGSRQKSQLVADMLASGEIAAHTRRPDVSIWAALRGIERDPETGRYPIRDDTATRSSPPDVAVLRPRPSTVRQGLADGLDVGGDELERRTWRRHWQEVAAAQGATFRDAEQWTPAEATVRGATYG